MLLLLRRTFLDPEVLHIAASEDDVLVYLRGGRDFLFWIALAAFGSPRSNVFERYCGLFRINFV